MANIQFPEKKLRKRAVTYLVKEDQVLLGQRKEGIGSGNFVGIGGKQEKNETIEQTAIRELQEEIGVEAQSVLKLGSIKFYFPHKPDYDQEVVPFLCFKWKNEPIASDEIEPKWFNRNQLPFANMWDDSIFWLPFILRGVEVKASFIYKPDNVVEYMKVKVNQPT